MAKANVILQNSILWNLREVTKLAEEIKKHCGDVDCTSWRYPLTSCSELEIFKLLQTNRNLDSYTYVLELTYDRLLYLFNLMIKYMESKDSLKKFRPGKNVCRPKTLSLASILHMIWDRIRAQMENVSRPALPQSSHEDGSEGTLPPSNLTISKSSIYTQSEVCSISLCSCCEMVQTFVTQLVLEMEKLFERQDFNSAILEERKNMREYLVEMTNWSAMTRWLTAIIRDFTTLSERLEQLTANSRKLRHRLDSGERKMKSKTEQLEEDIRKMDIRLKDKESRMSEMRLKVEKLYEEKNYLNESVKKMTSELESKEHKMEQMRKNFEKKLKEKKEKRLKEEQEREEKRLKEEKEREQMRLKEEKEREQMRLKEEKEREQMRLKEENEREEMRNSLIAERKKLEEVESQNENLEKVVLRMKEEWEILNSKADHDKTILTKRLNEMEIKLEALKEENLQMSAVIEEKEKTIRDYSTRIMEAFPELTESPKPKYAASGNPETDMENQMEANRLRVEMLISENDRLQITLNKIKSLKG